MDSNLEEKLGAILSDPDMMQKIQAMAQSLGQTQAPQTKGPDPALPGKLSGPAGQSAIDQNQKNLLTALSPYMPQTKVAKLENAMKAAKLARLASGFLSSGGLQMLTGR